MLDHPGARFLPNPHSPELPRKPRMTVRPIFAWYDLWIGAFWDRKGRRLYILPLPCVGIVIQFSQAGNV